MLDTSLSTTTIEPQPMRIFLSYCSADAEFAGRLRTALEDQQCRVWMAPDSIHGQSSWAEQIVGAIESSSAVAILLTPSAMGSAHVAREVSLAVDAGTPIVPVRITESSLSGALQYLLQLSQWLDAFDVPVETCAAAILDRVNCPEPPEDLAPAALAFPATARASVAIQPGTLVGGDASYSVDFLGLRVGRTPDNDVVVGDPSVSRHHCTISATEDGFLLTDLHATNGTKVNGQLVSHWRLSDGDRLQVGDAEFRFAWPAP